jgi:hypothetical protein
MIVSERECVVLKVYRDRVRRRSSVHPLARLQSARRAYLTLRADLFGVSRVYPECRRRREQEDGGEELDRKRVITI